MLGDHHRELNFFAHGVEASSGAAENFAYQRDGWCGTETPPLEDQLAMIQKVKEHQEHKRRNLLSPSFTIPVKFIHVKDPSWPSFDEADLQAKVDLLNDLFVTDCLNFTYDSLTEETSNPDWIECSGTSELSDMGAAYNVGADMTILHVFICDVGPGRDGFAYLPWTTPLNSITFRNLNSAYMSNYTILDPVYRYVLGHEVGHWLGLLHP